MTDKGGFQKIKVDNPVVDLDGKPAHHAEAPSHCTLPAIIPHTHALNPSLPCLSLLRQATR